MKRLCLFIVLMILGWSTTSALADAALRPGDSFDLRLGGVPANDMSTISGNYTIDGEGYVNLSYIGRIRAAGLTTSQVQSVIERAYVDQGIFTHPSISLTVASASRFVNVSGAVRAPQRVPYTADMTIMMAINASGDFNEFANRKSVRLTRGGKVEIIDCRKSSSQDVKVLPGDQIVVPESMF